MLTFHKVETEEDLKQVYRLRYQIYCLEKGYEPKEKYPDGIEMDEYDVYSIHFISSPMHSGSHEFAVQFNHI